MLSWFSRYSVAGTIDSLSNLENLATTTPAKSTVVTDSTIAAYLGKEFFQLAYTNNFEEAQIYFKEKMGVNKFMF